MLVSAGDDGRLLRLGTFWRAEYTSTDPITGHSRRSALLEISNLSRLPPAKTRKKFRSDLDKRDVYCIVTGQALCLTFTASHLIPKRLGDSNAREIAAAFSGPTFSVSTNLHHFDAMLGVLLNLTIDAYVDGFLEGP